MAATHIHGPLVEQLLSIATAAGTTTLTVECPGLLVFTGSTTQTVLMPPANVVHAGWRIKIINLSSGTVTVQDSSTGAITTISGSAAKTITCITDGSAAGTWSSL